MNGFIEVTAKRTGIKILVNIKLVREFLSNGFIYFENKCFIECKETYEEIKELIRNAQ